MNATTPASPPTSLLEALSLIRDDLAAVDAEIARRMDSPVRLIAEVAQHTLAAGGKRLRPALALLSARTVGTVNERVITFAAVTELTHTATLIHDDIIDHAEFRRGRPAAPTLWGSHVAVLVGDYFFSQVFQAMSEDGLTRLMPSFAQATAALCQGEIEEIELRGNWRATEPDYLLVIQHKTAELMRAAAALGALAGGGTEAQATALGTYGLNIGMAFQLVDDILDVTGSQQQLGKPAGHDLLEGAVTLPVIRTLSVATPAERERVLRLLANSSANGNGAYSNGDPGDSLEAVGEVLTLMHKYDGIVYAREVAAQYVAAARAALVELPVNRASAILESVCDFVLARQA